MHTTSDFQRAHNIKITPKSGDLTHELSMLQKGKKPQQTRTPKGKNKSTRKKGKRTKEQLGKTHGIWIPSYDVRQW